jgi:hypothetical protein
MTEYRGMTPEEIRQAGYDAQLAADRKISAGIQASIDETNTFVYNGLIGWDAIKEKARVDSMLEQDRKIAAGIQASIDETNKFVYNGLIGWDAIKEKARVDSMLERDRKIIIGVIESPSYKDLPDQTIIREPLLDNSAYLPSLPPAATNNLLKYIFIFLGSVILFRILFK